MQARGRAAASCKGPRRMLTGGEEAGTQLAVLRPHGGGGREPLGSVPAPGPVGGYISGCPVRCRASAGLESTGMGRWCPGTRSSVRHRRLGGAGDWARPGSSQDQSGRKRSRPRPSTELRPLVLATTLPTPPSLSWGRQWLASLPQAPSAVALPPPRAALRGLLCGPRPRPRPCWPARQPQPGSSHWTATHRRQEATAGCWEGRGHRDRAAGHQLARTWPRRAAEPSPTVPGYGSQSPAVPS